MKAIFPLIVILLVLFLLQLTQSSKQQDSYQTTLPFKIPTENPFCTLKELEKAIGGDDEKYVTLSQYAQPPPKSHNRCTETETTSGQRITDGHNYDVYVKSGVVVLNSGMEEIMEQDNDSITIKFKNPHPNANFWGPGTRIVNSEDGLVLLVLKRNLTILTDSFFTYKFNIRKSTIQELFEQGTISFSSPPKANKRDMTFSKTGNIGLNYDEERQEANKKLFTLYSKGNFTVSCINCFLWMNVSFYFSVNFQHMRVKNFTAIVDGGIRTSATINVELKQEFSFSKNFEITKSPPMKFVISIAGIPVWFEVVPKLLSSIDLKATGSFSWKYDLNYNHKFGIKNSKRFNEGGKPVWKANTPKFTHAIKSSTFEFSVYPELEIKFLSLISTSFSPKPKLIAELDALGLDLYYQLDFGVKTKELDWEGNFIIIDKKKIPELSYVLKKGK